MFLILHTTAQKMKFSIKDFFSKCDQIRSFLKGELHFLCSVLNQFFYPWLEKNMPLVCLNWLRHSLIWGSSIDNGLIFLRVLYSIRVFYIRLFAPGKLIGYHVFFNIHLTYIDCLLGVMRLHFFNRNVTEFQEFFQESSFSYHAQASHSRKINF